MRPPVPFRRLLRVWDYLFGNATPALPRRRLTVEGLEDRTMLTAVPLTGPDGGLWVKVDTLTVATQPNQTPATGVVSSVVLDAGKTYLAVARGEARIANDATGYADAEYIRYTQAAGPQDGSSPGLPWVNHGVRLAGVSGGDSSGGFWGAYQSDHQYVRTVVGQGTKATGYYVDIPGYYGDNSGTLQVDLYAEVPTVTLTPGAAAYVEGSVATLDGTYDPAVSGPNPVVTVDWGDGTPPETLVAPQVAGGKFSAKHYYGDDRQPGDPVLAGTALVGGNFAAADKNTITVTVAGPAPAPVQSARAVVTINNAPPTRLDVVPKVPQPGQAAADGKVIILTTVSDPSNPPAALPPGVPPSVLDADGQTPHDLFRRTVDWGDGKPPEVVPYDVAVLSVHHDYNGVGELNPGERARNAVKTITVTANDDDEPGKTVSGTTTVQVRLEPPELGVVTVQPTGRPVTEPLYEGQRATASGSILHPGPAKWTSVLIDWGDKSEPTPAAVTTDAAGNVTYTADHLYRDNGTRPTGGVAPFTVTVVATAAGFPNDKLTQTGRADVQNVAPADLSAGIKAFGAFGERGVRIVGGSFTDPGLDDTHTVEVDWGDNTVTPPVPLGKALTFDAVANAGLDHKYAADGDYTITVTVRDKDGGTGVARLKFLSATDDVLSKVYSTSKEIQKQGVLDTVIAFGNQIVDWVASNASAFTAAIDGAVGFVNDLPKLEAQLRTLFGTSLPQVLDAVLEKPATFVTNLFDAAADVFTDFKNNFLATARDVALQYLSKKGGFGIADADIPTAEEFANVLTNPAPVAGFVLKVLGVTWDDVVAKVAVAVGPDNLEALTQVYNFIAGAIGDGKAGQAALVDAFRFDRPDSPVNKLLEKLGDADLEGQIRTAVQAALDGKGVTDQAVNAAVGGVIQTLPGLIAGKVATLLAGPGLGAGFTALKTLFEATTWLAGNLNAVVEHAAGLVKVFADSAGAMITDGAAWQAAKPAVVAALSKAIKDIGPTVIDFAATAAGVGEVATAAGNAVKGLRAGIDKKLDAAFKPVAAAGTKLLDKVLPTGVGVRADYTGLVGNVVTWKTGTETHRLWSTVDSKGKGTTWVASDKSEVGTLLTELGKVWKDDPTLSKAVTDGKDAFTVVSKEVGDVATADKSVRADIAAIKALVPPAQPNTAFDQKQDALQKQLAADTKTRVTEVGQVNTQVGTSAAPGVLPKSLEVLLAACFAAGTPLRTPWGAMSVEDIRAGESVMSRSEHDPSGPVEPKVVEEVFRRLGRVWHLTVGGHLIRTTAEHPFYVNGKGWAPCSGLVVGDRVLCEDGKWAEVEEVVDTGRLETVYNLRVADHHTYFVGCDEWGFAVWAHNLDCTNFDNVTPSLSPAQCAIIAKGAEKVLKDIEAKPEFRKYNVRTIVETLLLQDHGKYFASPDTLIKHLKGILGEFNDKRGPELGKFVALVEAAKRASQDHRVAIEAISDPTVKGNADVIDVKTQEAMQIKHVTSKNDQNVADHVLSSVNQLLGRKGEVPPAGYKLIAWVIVANPANPWNSAKTPEDIATILDRDYIFNQSSPTFMNLTAAQLVRRDAMVIRIELANGSVLEVTYKDLKPGV